MAESGERAFLLEVSIVTTGGTFVPCVRGRDFGHISIVAIRSVSSLAAGKPRPTPSAARL